MVLFWSEQNNDPKFNAESEVSNGAKEMHVQDLLSMLLHHHCHKRYFKCDACLVVPIVKGNKVREVLFT